MMNGRIEKQIRGGVEGSSTGGVGWSDKLGRTENFSIKAIIYSSVSE